MKQRFLPLFAAVCFIGISLLGCKEDTILDANVIPVGDTANTVAVNDTLLILTKTVFDDSLVTSLSTSGVPIIQALGTINNQITGDPYSGKTNASIYLQVVPPTLGFTFPKTPDSAVLILPYAGFTWGDTTATHATQTFNVYEIADSLSTGVTYYSSTNKTVDRSSLLGSATISYNPTTLHPGIEDSITINGTRLQPHLRIKMSQAFVDKIKNEAATGNSLKAYADFILFLKGLCIEPDTTAGFGNALYYFRLDGNTDYNRANLLFYYTDKNSSNQDTVKTASFFYNSTYNAHYNKITRNYTGTPTAAIMASTAASDSVVILQNEPGAALDIKIPNIKSIFSDNKAKPIIKAELIITQVTNDFITLPNSNDQYQKFTPPSRLFPVGISPTGTTYSIQDRFPTSSIEPLLFMDGLRRDAVIDGKTVSQYVLNIPREVQKAIVEQRDTLHLRVSGAVTYPGAYRLIGGGRNLSNNNLRIKLNIVYSKIK